MYILKRELYIIWQCEDSAKKRSTTLKRYVYWKLNLVKDINDVNCKKIDVAIKTLVCKLTISGENVIGPRKSSKNLRNNGLMMFFHILS